MSTWKLKVLRRLQSAFPVVMSHVMYRRRVGRPLRLCHPQTYNEKINWLKLYDFPRDEQVIRCADKLGVRCYAAERGLKRYLNKLYGTWDDPRDIDFDALPNQFALKVNHGCKMNLLCRDKSRLDREAAMRQLERWLRRNFGLDTGQRHYCAIPRKAFCEALIEGEEPGEPPQDYKVLCLHGEPILIIHLTGRAHTLRTDVYDLNWNPVPISTHPSNRVAPRPRRLPEMLDVARTLSADFPAVRVDLYTPRDRVIIGEMTFTPAAGFNDNFTEEGDRWLGEMLDISDRVEARRHFRWRPGISVDARKPRGRRIHGMMAWIRGRHGR